MTGRTRRSPPYYSRKKVPVASSKQFAVIGLGRFGTAVCRTLTGLGHEVLGLDADAELVRRAQDEEVVTHVIEADATNIHALREAGLTGMDTVVVAIGSNLEASVLIVLNLLELGTTQIVAKASHKRYGEVLARVGGGQVRVVYPEEQMGQTVAHGLGGLGVMASIDLDPLNSIVEVLAPAALVGYALAESRVRTRWGVSVIAIQRQDKLNAAPSGTDRIEPGDVLALIGPNERIAALRAGREP